MASTLPGIGARPDRTLALNMNLLSHHELQGFGGIGEGMGMQLARDGRRILWLAHESAPKNFTAVDVTDPKSPRVVVQTELPHAKVRSNSLDVVGDVITELGPLAQSKRQVVTVSQSGLRPIDADHDKVHQIIVNLVSNAIRYTPEDGSPDKLAWLDAEGFLAWFEAKRPRAFARYQAHLRKKHASGEEEELLRVNGPAAKARRRAQPPRRSQRAEAQRTR